MKISLFAFISVASACWLSSCKKSSENGGNNGGNGRPDTVVTADTIPAGVYAVGYVGKNTYSGTWAEADFWQNGVPAILPDNYPSLTSAIVATKNNIIITGSTTEFTDIYQATYWHNGVKHLLTDTSSDANGIVISGKDTYIVGGVNPKFPLNFISACYWKNNKKVKLPDLNTWSNSFGVAIGGNDLYIIGHVGSNTGGSQAVYWKNGVLNLLNTTNINGITDSEARSIFINGTDVYIAGNLTFTNGNTSAGYWKNGLLTALSDSTYSTNGYGIAVNGSDVYVVGQITTANYTRPIYWKNNTPFTLLDGKGNYGSAQGISINGNDNYIAGWDSGGACYWKNGTAVQLGGGTLLAITIVSH